jgi:hypothetical protein
MPILLPQREAEGARHIAKPVWKAVPSEAAPVILAPPEPPRALETLELSIVGIGVAGEKIAGTSVLGDLIFNGDALGPERPP